MENIFKTAGIKLPANNTLDEMEKLVAVAKLQNQHGWKWYVIAGDELPNGDVYCFGYVEGNYNELGFFMLSEILAAGAMLGLTFKPSEIKTLK